MRKALASGLVVVLSLLALAAPAGAQEETLERVGPPPVQYNFAPPGARSLAMGAAFIGLADDATASESNPAGLTILTKPELSAQFRYSEFESTVPNTVTAVGFETFTARVGSPSFFSVVYPWRKVAASFYYQRAADYRSASKFDGFLDEVTFNEDLVEVHFRTENIGLSGAVKLGDKVSIGGSVRATRVRVDSLQSFAVVQPFLDDDGVLFLERFRELRAIDDSKTKMTFNAGILVAPTPKISLGAVYKRGADFAFTQTITPYVDGFDYGPDLADPPGSEPIRITVPDVFGAGLAFKPTDQLTIVADVVRVNYSDADLGPNGQSGYQRFGEGGGEPLKDATEFHAGLEYTWAEGNDWIFSFRSGFYSNPDHDGLGGLDSEQIHATFGGGVVFRSRLQVDLAANVADAIKEGLISFVVRF